jgi:hypothetical protein
MLRSRNRRVFVWVSRWVSKSDGFTRSADCARERPGGVRAPRGTLQGLPLGYSQLGVEGGFPRALRRCCFLSARTADHTRLLPRE